jgi:malonyl CoA-acyl carrier protein transacylase/phosphopantetheinyl transferase
MAQPPAWETELFVVRGADRGDLHRRTLGLAAYLARHPDVVLKDLAFTLNTSLESGGSRLAVAANSHDDLRDCLERAAALLADAGCRRVQDAQGIYYFDEPLYPQGRVALLFPGEGAQYLNMLADLFGHFPEVHAPFQWCDRQGGPGGKLSDVLFAPAAESERAGKELRRLDTAIASILAADLAVFALLQQLGVPADVVGGHSAGELAALGAAGCLDPGPDLLEQVLGTMRAMQAEEDASGVGEAALLAVGAGGRVVAEVIERAGPGAYLAMDNCPHQSVVAGPPGPVAAVRAELRARGIPCEPLPLYRPYHTPLFEPSLRPLRQVFDAIPFRSPRAPIYSCTTGRPFPPEPDEVRRLAAATWVSPVAFTAMVEAMYADGVRLFVEAGPGGCLTAFVEDILRGRPFAAVAANLERLPGLTQVHHLAALLAAHHVPLRLDHLYRRRDPRPVSWEDAPAPDSRGTVVCRHWEVMEQFLDLQEQVMGQFLASRRRIDDSPMPSAPAGPAAWPLLGEVVRHEPGRELVVHRRLDLREDLYAADHTLGGRDVSRTDPTQHGLPVLPMTFTLEMMAEAAAALVPGKVVTAIRDVKLLRWLALDEEPLDVEVVARLLPGDSAVSQVAVSVHDRGARGGPDGGPATAAEGTVVLDDGYPEPPAVGDFPLSDERPSRFTLQELYRNLLHGPLFQGVCSLDRMGAEGIEAQVRVLPREGLFRSNPDPDWRTDPVLIDVAMHPLSAWHLEQPDQKGRLLLPCALGAIEFFGPRPAVGTRVTSRIRTEHVSARQFSHGIEMIGPGRRLWCRLSAARYWRFYLPFGDVCFHGPKDEYFLSRDWPQALASGDETTPARCVRLDVPPDLRQGTLRLATARVTLSPAELQRFREVEGEEERKAGWLFGRIAAKDAVRLLWKQHHGEGLFPADIEIDRHADGRRVARRRGPGPSEDLATVSLTRADGVVAALAAFGPHAGIDLEHVRPRGPAFEENHFDARERQLLDGLGPDRDEWVIRFFCAREAIAKGLGRELVAGASAPAVREADVSTGTVRVALGSGAELLAVRTVRDGDLVAATTLCTSEETDIPLPAPARGGSIQPGSPPARR